MRDKKVVYKNATLEFHPLLYLRNFALFRMMQRCVDFPVFVKLDGIGWKIQVRLARHISWILKPKDREPNVGACILALNKVLSLKVFWDIGANIGYYTWLLLTHNGEVKAYLFECDPECIKLLKNTIKKSGINNAHVIDKAISSKRGEELFVVDDISGEAGALERRMESRLQKFLRSRYALSKKVMVKTETLDNLKDDMETPDLIKIDAEGSEEDIIDGAEALIKEKQPVMILECLDYDRKASLIPKLEKSRYKLFNITYLEIKDEPHRANNILAIPVKYHNKTDDIFKVLGDELRRAK